MNKENLIRRLQIIDSIYNCKILISKQELQEYINNDQIIFISEDVEKEQVYIIRPDSDPDHIRIFATSLQFILGEDDLIIKRTHVYVHDKCIMITQSACDKIRECISTILDEI